MTGDLPQLPPTSHVVQQNIQNNPSHLTVTCKRHSKTPKHPSNHFSHHSCNISIRINLVITLMYPFCQAICADVFCNKSNMYGFLSNIDLILYIIKCRQSAIPIKNTDHSHVCPNWSKCWLITNFAQQYSLEFNCNEEATCLCVQDTSSTSIQHVFGKDKGIKNKH